MVIYKYIAGDSYSARIVLSIVRVVVVVVVGIEAGIGPSLNLEV